LDELIFCDSSFADFVHCWGQWHFDHHQNPWREVSISPNVAETHDEAALCRSLESAVFNEDASSPICSWINDEAQCVQKASSEINQTWRTFWCPRRMFSKFNLTTQLSHISHMIVSAQHVVEQTTGARWCHNRRGQTLGALDRIDFIGSSSAFHADKFRQQNNNARIFEGHPRRSG
jgi:hypothetical protein